MLCLTKDNGMIASLLLESHMEGKAVTEQILVKAEALHLYTFQSLLLTIINNSRILRFRLV